MTPRTIVLLGAGASRDAGLPLTSELAQILVRNLNEELPEAPEVQALNFVYSAMVGHQGETGGDPLKAVNIETLISAVRLLQDRESHEVAPFVSSWKSGALGFGRTLRVTQYASQIERAVGRAIGPSYPSGGDLANVIANIARDATEHVDPSSFVNLEAKLLDGIRRELSGVQTTDYLTPLAALSESQVGGLDIVTLNYDLTVEEMAARSGTEVDRGIERWTAGVPLTFDSTDGRINLLKLHGSVDWELHERSPAAVHPPMIRIVSPAPEADGTHDRGSPRPGRPWIVVGDREKLSTDGPTLDLLHAAQEAFNRAGRLVVVGYSFADAHVNAIVRNWMAADPGRNMTVLDPGWPPLSEDDARVQFAETYGGSDDWNGPGDVPRIAALAESAAVGLSSALVTVAHRPEPWATARWAGDPSSREIIIHLHGPTLRSAIVQGWHGNDVNINVFDTVEARDEFSSRTLPPGSWQTARVGDLEEGAEVAVYPVVPEGAESLELLLEGQDLVGRRLIHMAVPTSVPGTPSAWSAGPP